MFLSLFRSLSAPPQTVEKIVTLDTLFAFTSVLQKSELNVKKNGAYIVQLPVWQQRRFILLRNISEVFRLYNG